MAADLKIWKKILEEIVDAIGNENYQRRAWFGLGPEESSPDEDICQLFGNGAIEAFLDRNDTGLNDAEVEAGKHLVKLMRELADEKYRTTEHINPSELIDDPRWREIRQAAARFHKLLQPRSIPT